ncbi:MAG: hypothetical protein HZB16_21520 [Armatimonadetes bacterium]|nr:hypothetical protein [Armatimonadota bacterium]
MNGAPNWWYLMIGLWLPALALLAMAAAGAVGTVAEARLVRLSRYGVYWLPRILPIPWSAITGIRAESGLWVLSTAAGDVPLPGRLRDVGPLVTEVRRRATVGEAVPPAPLGSQMLGWLGLEPGYRRQVRLQPDPRERQRLFVALCGVAMAASFSPICFAVGQSLEGLLLVAAGAFSLWRLAFRRPNADLAWFDDDCMEFDDRHGRRTKLPWHQLISLCDEGDRFTLVTTAQDLTILADGEAAAAVRHTAEQVLAALAANGGWAATPGDASLSPAERLTGEAERGLSVTSGPSE